ncbi:MAG: hypothetical protein PSV22_02130, partial [Pseudolabrys sp.]|nr:hypothetical protein [Pseudolabrys sp.]
MGKRHSSKQTGGNMLMLLYALSRSTIRLLWVVVFLIGGALGLSYATPLWPIKAHALFSHFVTGWTEKACEHNQEACLLAKYAELDALHAQLAAATNALANQKTRIAQDLENRERDFASNQALLEQGRQIYLKARETNTKANFVGRDYTPDALQRQI